MQACISIMTDEACMLFKSLIPEFTDLFSSRIVIDRSKCRIVIRRYDCNLEPQISCRVTITKVRTWCICKKAFTRLRVPAWSLSIPVHYAPSSSDMVYRFIRNTDVSIIKRSQSTTKPRSIIDELSASLAWMFFSSSCILIWVFLFHSFFLWHGYDVFLFLFSSSLCSQALRFDSTDAVDKTKKSQKKSRKMKIEQKRWGQAGYCIDGETSQTLHGSQVKRRMFRRGLHDDESWMMTRGRHTIRDNGD